MTFSPIDHSHPTYTPAPTFGGVKKHRVTSAALVKPGKAVLIGWMLHNPGYADARVEFFDGEVFDWPLVIPAGGILVSEFTLQIPFFAGLSYRTAGGEVAGLLLYS
jgi:hypothetical protein